MIAVQMAEPVTNIVTGSLVYIRLMIVSSPNLTIVCYACNAHTKNRMRVYIPYVLK